MMKDRKALFLLVSVLGVAVLGCAHGPQASFSYMVTGLTVDFLNSSDPGTGQNSTYLWDFGDGASSTDPSPTHTYAQGGQYSASLTMTNTEGSNTHIAVFDLPYLPTASFTYTINELSLAFTDTSTPGSFSIFSRSWNFGDGATSTEQNPSHTYASAGTYAVSLTVTSWLGGNTVTQTVKAVVVPTASFAYTATGVSLTFTDTSAAGSAPISVWAWDFGDGATSAQQHPSHTYANAGTYTVALTVTTAAGSSGTSQSITVVALPTASFTYAAADLSLAFTDTSLPGSHPISLWSWGFGDGGTSAEQNPSHTYASAGTYTISLTVTTDLGSNSVNREVTVTVAPAASFTYVSSGLSVAFTDTSTAGSAPITAWAWDFGDGTTSAQQHPSHSYASTGSYTVALTVTTAVGNSNASQNITVNALPTASFTYTANDLSLVFTDTSTPGGAAISAWAWDFGDDGTSTEQNPSHTYASSGTYTVSLTVTTSVGTNTSSREIPVTVAAVASFTYVANGVVVAFTDTSTAGSSAISAWAWNFGDGATSTEQSPSHTYASVGSYSVTLQVTTAVGSDSCEQDVSALSCELISIPAGSFTMGNTNAGDDSVYYNDNEAPTHDVYLSAYAIGKYTVTNQQYVDALNWALARGSLSDINGASYSGGDVYAAGKLLLYMSDSDCHINYVDGAFVPVTRTGTNSVIYSMEDNPAIDVTWYGAAMYCNWLSEQDGLTPCYDTDDWSYVLTTGGYHLPTEAQWERAAAWDGSKHWVYGYTSDTLSSTRCNYNAYNVVNPLGLTRSPYTSPVGWFDGVNISPNGSVQTEDSPSPVGCYDMSGNVVQWCNDWFGADYYTTCSDAGSVTDPLGPETGDYRVYRGSGWSSYPRRCRTAFRGGDCEPGTTYNVVGFRLARNP